MSIELKVCSKCHLELPIAKFSVVVKATGRRRAHCNDCESARVRAFYAANPDYRATTKANSVKWAKANPEKRAKIGRGTMLKAKYGLTHEQFDQLLAAQDGCCALCKSTDHGVTGQSGRYSGTHVWLEASWRVDHCHADGRVRGLLCHNCNTRLGSYEALLKEVGEDAVLDYLTRPSPVLALPIAPIPELVPAPRFVAELPPRYVSHTCSVEGCDGPCHGGGFCFKHYMRARRRGGDTELAGPTTGAGHHKSTLTESQAREIKFSTEKGADLARKFAVKPSVISSIRHGHTWKHLEPETMQ